MSEIALVHVTFASAADAERIGETLVAERLAACVDIAAPCTSIYRRRGEVERGEEVPATFKTTMMLARRLADRLAALHDYDLPAIETVVAQVDERLARWVAEASR